MTKPANFPEQKRLRQIKALGRIKPRTAGKPDKGVPTASNAVEIEKLKAAIAAGDQSGVHTKKDRSTRGRFIRAA